MRSSCIFNMESLPLDLLRSVVQHIPKQDLPAARLVCRSFNEFSLEYLYCEITVWIQRQSLERLLNISRCDYICKHVRKLTLSFELLQKQLPSQERYLQWLYQQQTSQHTSTHQTATLQPLTFANIGALTRRDDWTPERVTTAYATYKLRVEEQRTIELLGMGVITLTMALSRLNNLCSIIIKSDYYGQLPIDPADFPKDIAVIYRETLLSPFYTQQTRLKDTGRLHLRDLIHAAAVTGAKITELTISDSDNTMAPRILALCPEDLQIAVAAFQHVRRFYFKLPDYNVKEGDANIFAAGQLAQLVQTMPKLEELTLVSSSCTPSVPWTTVCGTGRLNFLRVLDLQCFDFHEAQFIEFLIRHRCTLRVVNLFCIEMYSGTFTSLFHSMRENLSLVSLDLDGVLEDDDGNFLDYSYAAAKALEDFVTRRTEEFPTSLLRRHQRGSSVDGEE